MGSVPVTSLVSLGLGEAPSVWCIWLLEQAPPWYHHLGALAAPGRGPLVPSSVGHVPGPSGASVPYPKREVGGQRYSVGIPCKSKQQTQRRVGSQALALALARAQPSGLGAPPHGFGNTFVLRENAETVGKQN